jgi:prephenate dehydrogenase
MTPRFEQAAIIGVGLLGASLGLALKSRGLAKHIIGVGHRVSSLATALQAGAIDAYTLDVREAAAQADLVAIATPAALVVPKLDEIRDACKAAAIVTDVASTKRAICEHARATWPHPRRFVGSHPMAGSEKFGAEHGQPDLYENSVCLVERGNDVDPEARRIIVALWEAVGARVVDVEPAAHDALLANSSHLPHVIASALAASGASAGIMREVIGKGFLDMTRIAASRPEVWRDICLTNDAAILEAIERYQRQLEDFAQVLRAGDADAVETFFRAGNQARRELVGE